MKRYRLEKEYPNMPDYAYRGMIVIQNEIDGEIDRGSYIPVDETIQNFNHIPTDEVEKSGNYIETQG